MSELIRPHNPAKQFLRRYGAIQIRIASICRESASLRELLTSTTARLDGVSVTGSTGDRMAAVVAQIVDMQAVFADEITKLQHEQRDILDAINSVTDENQKNVLTLRYVEGMDWQSIQAQLHYEKTQVYVIHGRALVAVNQWLEGRAPAL